MLESDWIRQRRPAWEELDTLVRRASGSGLRRMAPDELDRLARLYRRATSDLALARSRFPGSPVEAYLNDLVARAYVHVYQPAPGSWRRLRTFFTHGFPLAVRAHLPWVLVAAGLLWVSAAAAFAAVMWGPPDLAYALVPPDMHGVVDALSDTGSESAGGEVGGDGPGAWDLAAAGPALSALIMTNNIQVAFIAFATGILLGVGTAYVMVLNGFMLGALAALAHRAGEAVLFWSLILPHGITELAAIHVSGAAGFLLAAAVIAPGDLSRRHSLVLAGRAALRLLGGTVAMLVAAGIIEGFITPSGLPPWAKLAFAAATAVALGLYIFWPRRKEARIHDGADPDPAGDGSYAHA